MINLDLEKQISQQIEKTIREYLDSESLKTKIQEQVNLAISDVIKNVAANVFNQIIGENNINDQVIRLVNLHTSDQILEQSKTTVESYLNKTPVNKIIDNIVKQHIDFNFKNISFPENSINPSAIAWAPGSISGSHILGGKILKFSSTGINDKAKSCQLTVLDEDVVVENNFTARNINVVENLTVENLSLTGSFEIGTEIIDHGPFSQLIQLHSQMMVDEALQPYKGLIKDNKPVIDEGVLASHVTSSNLRRVGNLQDLTVLGDAKFSETVFIGSNGKVGINTDEPKGALTIRDDDAEVTLGRSRRKTMFIGTTLDSELDFGINNKTLITIKENQVDFDAPIRIMGIKFSAAPKIPEHIGDPNEIVMVTTAKAGQPLFYICRGGNKWQAI